MTSDICACCGSVIEPRDPDPWEGRMDDYCWDCCDYRCDAYGHPAPYLRVATAPKGL